MLVLHRLLRAWSGLCVFPLSCPLHYPAVSCKPATTLVPHLGAKVGLSVSLIVLLGPQMKTAFAVLSTYTDIRPCLVMPSLYCVKKS